jgi:hypothetical protein
MPCAILLGDVAPEPPKNPSSIRFLMASIGHPRRPLLRISKADLNLEVPGPSVFRVDSLFGVASDSTCLGQDVIGPRLVWFLA